MSANLSAPVVEVLRLSGQARMGSWVEKPELGRFLRRGVESTALPNLCGRNVALSRLEKGFGFHSARPFHPLARIVEEWVASEVPLYGVRPTARFGAWLSFLPQKRKDSCRGPVQRAWSKQPKASNCVLIAFGNVLGPSINELL